MTRCLSLRITSLVLALVASTTVGAQWPDRPVRIIVPYVSGAMGDTVSRLLAEDLRVKFGQPVLIDNRPGAGGNIGTAAVVQAAPDGYTVLVGATNNFVINQYLYAGMGFDPLEALAPVTILVDVPSVIFLNGQVPARDLKSFVDYARANRGKLNFGSPGAGTTPHLSAAHINKTRELGMTHVPYKGASQAVAALLANDVQLYMGGAGLAAQHVKSGKLHAIAVSNARRLESFPEIPTFDEVGLGDVRASNFWAAAVPKGTPPEIAQRLYEAFSHVLSASATQERLRQLGVSAVGTPPAETARRFRDEAAYWQKAVKDMGVRID